MRKKTTKTNDQLLSELDSFCRNQNWHFSVTWQRVNDYSVEIYKGYISNYERIFHEEEISLRKALRKAIRFIEKVKKNDNLTST